MHFYFPYIYPPFFDVGFLMNGFQIRCQITGFDPFAVTVQAEGKQEMIYKHAISTIIPQVAFRGDTP